MRSTLRTVAKLLPLIARQRKAPRGDKEVATVSHVVHLIATLVAIDIANSCQTPAPRS
ncbi:hypothetical protein [Pilibacter termitis]|uniref:hypothetical protein n=1 Tax=Pilibacter termitis TaxID=263852 RepID=UPI00135662E6|nr:hypothetical protein [Pilibacter termitis]